MIERRLTTARKELDAQGEFDTVVVNDDVDAAVATIAGILQGTSSNNS